MKELFWLFTNHDQLNACFDFSVALDVLDLAWSPDDSFLASGSVDNTITIWNAQRFPGLQFVLIFVLTHSCIHDPTAGGCYQ